MFSSCWSRGGHGSLLKTCEAPPSVPAICLWVLVVEMEPGQGFTRMSLEPAPDLHRSLLPAAVFNSCLSVNGDATVCGGFKLRFLKSWWY